jgi:hypothetical protein
MFIIILLLFQQQISKVQQESRHTVAMLYQKRFSRWATLLEQAYDANSKA